MLSLPRKLYGRKVTGRFVLVIITVLFLAAIYCWHLSSMTPGMSPAEVASRTSSSSIQRIKDSPINAPHTLVQLGFQKLGRHNTTMRFVSVLFALFFIACFYRVVSSWFGRSVGWFSTIIFAMTPIIIVAGRSATPDIMALAPLAIGAIYLWFTKQTVFSKPIFLILLTVLALSLYVPGMVWLLLIAAVVSRKSFKKILNATSRRWLIASLVLPLILIVPLIWRLVYEPSLIRNLTLVPAHWQSVWLTIKSIVWMGLGLVWRTGPTSPLIIGRLPLLDIAQIALALFGFYAMWRRARGKTYGLLTLIIFGVLVAGINANVNLLIYSLPAIGVLMAAGLRYLYIEWKGIFPLNPIPRGLAFFLILLLTAIQVLYGAHYGLVAWPHTVATHTSYVLK